ncbi:phosphomevalonate kinase [Dyella flava]|nr:phosphomevalonate kinase [Dyella flava]
MELTASAPGKLVLLGEYAVLEGAPALVLAVNRRAHVRIEVRSDGVCDVHAPDLGVSGARMTVEGGALRWRCDDVAAAKLSLVEHVWQGLVREGLAPEAGEGFSLHLDTSGFFHVDGASRAKLGLGSSAALTVALASALAAFAGHADVLSDRTQWLRRLLHMHGGWQGGRGSGVDVAASVAGGLIRYQLAGQAREPTFAPLPWPMTGVHCLFVWSGQSVSTNDFLQRLAQWRVSRAADYASHMRELGTLSEAGLDALGRQDAQSFVELTKAYASALQQFGHACGLEIYSPEQKKLADMASEAGVSYKPCGAGGDFGVVFADDPERLATFERAIVPAGMHVVPLGLDSDGVSSHMRLARNLPPSRILT